MSKEHELPSDSDEDDEDYVPRGIDSEAGSEVESEGEAESGPDDENDENLKVSERRKGKGKKRSGKKNSGSKKKSRKLDGEQGLSQPEKDAGVIETEKKLSEEDEKKRADSLWADFMKDTRKYPEDRRSKPNQFKSVLIENFTSTAVTSKAKQTKNTANSFKETSAPFVVAKETRDVEKVKITKLFEFAGEEVRVEKEVPADSAEARLTLPSSLDSKSESTQSSGGGRGRGIRKVGLGGISSVLGQLGKKAKISVLEKSKLDWDSYKKEEKIEEEISTHNKGKGGYLEKQDFLQRADLRQFEIEKQMRSSRRSTR